MEKEASIRRSEDGAGGDPRPTMGDYLREVINEVEASLVSSARWDLKLHQEKARVAAIQLIRSAQPEILRNIGIVLTARAKIYRECMMGTYEAIRDAYSIDKAVML